MNASMAGPDVQETRAGRAEWASAAGEGTEKKKGPQPLRLRPLPGGWMRGCFRAFHKLRRTSEQKVWAYVGFVSRFLTNSLTTRPSTVAPPRAAIVAFMTLPMSFGPDAPVSATAVSIARPIAASSAAGGR